MATTIFALTQSGYDDGVGWVDLGALTLVGLSATGYAGTRWAISTKNVVATTLTLALQQHGASPDGSGLLTVYSVRENSCAAFSTIKMPADRRLEPAYSGTVTFTGGNTVSIDIPLSTASGQPAWPRSALGFGADPNQLGLVFGWGDVVNDVTVIPSLTLAYTSAFTGLEGPWRAMGRADHCPKCGLPSTRDTWVRDRFSDKMVCKRCYDPFSIEDVSRRRGVGREREGVGEG